MGAPTPFKETERYSSIYGHPVRCFKQNGWYYDRFLNPVEEVKRVSAPKNLARMRAMNSGARKIKSKFGNLGKVDPIPEEIKRAMRENAKARKAEDFSE